MVVACIVEDQENLAALVVVSYPFQEAQKADSIESLGKLEVKPGPIFNADCSKSFDGPTARFALYDRSGALDRPGPGP
jgi:hypothetical protein